MKYNICSIIILCFMINPVVAQEIVHTETRILIQSDGWELVGDLLLPDSNENIPAVLLLNKAAGDRKVYKNLANLLANRGIASLRLDLRGHGESINKGRFIPGEKDTIPFPFDSEADLTAAHNFLKDQPGIDAQRIGMVGSSYSGEEMAQAGRNIEYCQAYVALSPGSFSKKSILDIDPSGIPWLIIIGKQDEFLQTHIKDIQEFSQKTELLIIPGAKHATDILEYRLDITERIVIWMSHALKK